MFSDMIITEQHIQETTGKELNKASAKAQLGKVPGTDNITPLVTKFIEEVGETKNLVLLNDIAKKSIIPEERNIGIFLSLLKKEDTRECNNYSTQYIG